jgi:hypothetical protein
MLALECNASFAFLAEFAVQFVISFSHQSLKLVPLPTLLQSGHIKLVALGQGVLAMYRACLASLSDAC